MKAEQMRVTCDGRPVEIVKSKRTNPNGSNPDIWKCECSDTSCTCVRRAQEDLAHLERRLQKRSEAGGFWATDVKTAPRYVEDAAARQVALQGALAKMRQRPVQMADGGDEAEPAGVEFEKAKQRLARLEEELRSR